MLPTMVVGAHQRFKHAGLSAALAANNGNLWKTDPEVQGDLHVTNMIPSILESMPKLSQDQGAHDIGLRLTSCHLTKYVLQPVDDRNQGVPQHFWGVSSVGCHGGCVKAVRL